MDKQQFITGKAALLRHSCCLNNTFLQRCAWCCDADAHHSVQALLYMVQGLKVLCACKLLVAVLGQVEPCL
jgi:hypothetical protein